MVPRTSATAQARRSPTVRIPLTGRRGEGRYALVDAADADRVLAHRWHIQLGGYRLGGPYARRGGGGAPVVFMHRFILGLEPGDRHYVDHINGDGLDNRRGNLRIATAVQNGWNQRRPLGSVPMRGVVRRRNGFMSRIRDGSRRLYLGTFPTAEEAAAAYDAAALELHGAFAVTNAAAGLLPRGGGR